jgi:hypothetical protein
MVQCETLSFFVTWGNRASGATYRVAGYNFSPLSGESGILALRWGSEGSFDVRESGRCWASMLHGKGSFPAPTEQQSLEPGLYLGVW